MDTRNLLNFGTNLTRPCDNAEYNTGSTNEIGQRLGHIIHNVFGDLHDDNQMSLLSQNSGYDQEELFANLYVPDRYGEDIDNWPMNRFYKETLGTTRPQRFEAEKMNWEPIKNVISTNNPIINQDDLELASILLSGDDFRPSILVGRVGCGKTTFLKRFILYIAPKINELNNFVFLHLDFARDEIKGNYFKTIEKQLDEPFDLVLDTVLTEYFNEHLNGLPPLESVFKYTYQTENIERVIETWPKRLRNDKRQEWYRQKFNEKNEFNYARIKYLQKTLAKRVIVILDNVDEWEMVDQRNLIKNALYKQTWHGSGLLLVARHNALSEIQNNLCYSQFRPFSKHLTPPRINQVLNKRLTLLQTIFQKNDLGPYLLIDYPLPAKVIFSTNEQLLDFLRKITTSLTNGDAEEFVSHFKNHNVREMLNFSELYLTSPNTEIWRFLPEIVKIPNEYTHVGFWDQGYIGLHSLITVAALKNGAFYHPIDSLLCNLFCNDSAVEEFDSLIRLRILEYVSRRDSTNQSMLYQGFSDVGYSKNQIKKAIQKLIMDGLIETREHINDPNAILFTTIAGKYYLTTLIHQFAYLQHMRNGCYLPGFERPILNKVPIEDRLLYVAKFIDFLDQQEISEREKGLSLNPSSYRIYCGKTGTSIPRITSNLIDEIQKINIIDKNIRRKSISILQKVADRH